MLICSNVAKAAGKLTATVIAERGSVTVERDGTTQFQSLVIQDGLCVGDAIRTSAGADVDILFTNGSQVKLGPNSMIRILANPAGLHSQNLFFAICGVIWAHLKPDTHVETPSAIVIVRGTEIALNIADDGTTQLTVVSGDASFYNAEGSVEVVDNQQSTAQPGRAPTAPVAVDATGLISWTADIVTLPLIYQTQRMAALTTLLRSHAEPGAPLAAELDAAPTTAAGWDALGDARRTVGDPPGAIDAYNTALGLDPNDIDSRVGIALTQFSRNLPTEAKAELAQVAGNSDPLAVMGLIDLIGNDVPTAKTELAGAIALNPKNASALALLALADLQDGQNTYAEANARQAVAINPQSATAEGSLSIILFFEGRTREAAAVAQKAVELDNQAPLALLAEGRSHVVAGRYDEARTVYEKALVFGPKLWLLHEELAGVYERLGRPSKAKEEDNIALSINPLSADAYAGLGKAQQDLAQYDAANKSFKQAVALDGSNESVRYYYASFLVDRGDLDGAFQQINAVTDSNSKFGLLYARMAEVYLYKQNLFSAQIYANKAVKILPQSAIAHYELGRVYLEQQHTYQAQQEFRIATVLDSKLTAARYALGLVEEKTQSGLLQSFNTIFDSDQVGSPASAQSVNNLETPGANNRVQAEVMDPTSVRSATRSYGNTEIDGDIGSRGSHDLAASYLTETPNGRGVVGVDGESQFQEGVRADSDNMLNTANFIFGQKATDSSLGFTLIGNYEQKRGGDDSQLASNNYAASSYSNSQIARILAGSTVPTGASGNILVLFQASDDLFGTRPTITAASPYYNAAHLDIDSVDAELRWDEQLGPSNQLNAGISYGNRRRSLDTSNNAEPFMPIIALGSEVAIAPLQGYIRDNIESGKRWSGVAELKYVQEYPADATTSNVQFILPNSKTSSCKNVVLPYLILAEKPDDTSVIRLRYRQIAASTTDFDLLEPTDDFLISYVGLPQSTDALYSGIATGTSTEVEWDKALRGGSFLSIGAFRQNLKEAGVDASGPYTGGDFATLALDGVQASYQGSISKTVTYFVLGNFSNQEDTSVGRRVPYVPYYTGIATLQYLSPTGFYSQVAEYYQGDRPDSQPGQIVTGAFGVLDLRIGKRVGLRSNIYVEINNLLDKKYDLLGYAEPGTEVLLGASRRY
jgi:tetratricopeptide (TPR) repeat protein